MALLAKEQAAINEALKRGLSQQKINTFLAENPNDYSRLKDQQPDTPRAGAGGGMATGGNMPMPGGNMPTPGGATPASVVGLDKAAGGGGGDLGMPGFTLQEPAGPGMQGAASGMLRPNMGMRQPPQPNMALAALKRIY